MDLNFNLKHKDSVFSKLFSSPEILRELYSAIEGIDVPKDAIVDINTLSDVLFMKKINDLSFTIDDRLIVLFEHQSTISENIPLRVLMYIARVYEKIIEKETIYHKKLVKIPRPEFIVLYNGKDEYPDQHMLFLSTAFKDVAGLKLPENMSMPLELVVNVFNINHNRNPEILKRSETLNGYSIFVEKYNEYREYLSVDESAKKVIEYCIEHNILREFMEKHGSEVANMLYENFTIEEIAEIRAREAAEDAREEGLEKGRVEGSKEEKLTIARNLLAEGSTPEFVQKITGLSLDEIAKL